VLLAPAAALIGAFAILPAGYAFVMSLHRLNFIRLERFVGLDNYRLLLQSTEMRQNIAATLIFVVGTLVGAFMLGLVLALILNERIHCRAAFRAIVLIPWITSQVVSTMLMRWLLDYDYGLINAALSSVGMTPISFLSSADMAMSSLIGTNVWRTTAFVMVLVLAALQSVPDQIHEAACVDGASWLARLRMITLPLMRTPLLIVIVILTMGYLQSVTPVLILTGGGPGRSTEVLSLRMWHEAFTDFRMDQAATVAMTILAVNVVLTVAYFRILRQQSHS
jgi:multiple sugar transport system permease protein